MGPVLRSHAFFSGRGAGTAQLLLAFINKHLELVGVIVTDLAIDLHDGVNLVLLIGVLGGMFVPLYNYKSPVSANEDKILNVQLAFRLMESMQISANGIAVTGPSTALRHCARDGSCRVVGSLTIP